jgi:3-isopropylmalate/(R)-2-methylmalate dehydratase small subunit
MTSLVLKGRVAARLGDNIDTDVIYPGRFLNITDREKTAGHLFELAYPEIRPRIRPGDFIVGGRNFGCGSSREQATAAVKYAGAGAVIAVSFARIFYRNSINLGLPALVSAEAVQELLEGDELEIDVGAGEIRRGGSLWRTAPLDPRAVELIRAGGLIPYLKAKYASA